MMGMLLYFFVALLCAGAAASIQSRKGRSVAAGVLVGLLFGPIGVLFALLSSTDHDVLEAQAVERGDEKYCPECAELVRAEASICRHCRHVFADADA